MAREAKKDFQGPFLGFTYNDRHSSELGIVRINTGNRAEMPLSPSFKDSTAEVPGGKGLYYFNTQIQQRQFTINFAYDDLTEEDVRELREWLNPLEQGELIFDEEPYKAYTVKPNTQPKLSYLVFDREITTETFKLYEPSTVRSSGRLYKGEGAIGLTAYYPYAKAPSKKLSYYNPNTKEGGFGSQDEWNTAGKITENSPNTGVISGNNVDLYYAGDITSPMKGELILRGKIGFKVEEGEEKTVQDALNALGINLELFNIIHGTNYSSNMDILLPRNYYTTSQAPEKGVIGLEIGQYYMYFDASKMEPNKKYKIDSNLQLILDGDKPVNNLILASTFLYLTPKDNNNLKLSIFSLPEGYEGSAEFSNIDYDYLYL